MRIRHAATHLCVLAITGALVAACSASSTDSTTAPTSSARGATDASYADAPCPTPNYPSVPQLDLGPEFTCGYLTVPENRSVSGGKTIKVAVARAKAVSSQPKSDPIVYLTGGPGGTAIVTAMQKVAAGWNADRDVIFIDQRGTYHSTPRLACPEIDAFASTALASPSMAATTRTMSVAATASCRARLSGAGWDLASYDTAENAADVADLRVALGIPSWNVYGVSYGSDLALQLVRDHPQGIRSLVLDSLVPPQIDVADQFWPNAADGLRELFAACAAQSSCRGAFPDLETEFYSTVARLAVTPRTVSAPSASGGPATRVVVDGYTFANLAIVASLVPGSIERVPAMIHNMATGDGTAAGSAAVESVPPPGVTGYGLTYGVFCRESVARGDRAQSLAIARGALPTMPASVLAFPPQAPGLFDDCAAWDVGAAPSASKPASSDVPVLMVEGGLDAVTPPAMAGIATRTLPKARTLVFPDAGHDVMLWSPTCGVAVMRNFLNNPTDYDAGCVDRIAPLVFTTG